jgi:hypothetical protein
LPVLDSKRKTKPIRLSLLIYCLALIQCSAYANVPQAVTLPTDTKHFTFLPSIQAGNGISPCTAQTSTESAGMTASQPASHATQIVNLLPNGTFEAGALDGWQPGDRVSASTTEAHSGAWSARMDYGGSGTAEMEADFNTTVDTTYKVTAWVKIGNQTGDDWGGFRLEAFSSDWNTLAHSGWLLQQVDGGDWFKIAMSFTATTPQTRLKVGYFGGSGRSMNVYVDDIMAFVKGANQPPDITATLTPTNSVGLSQTQQYALIGDDPDGAIVRVMWDFGDQTRALTPSGSRSVALPGSFVATVRVADDDGATTTQMLTWTAAGSGVPMLTITSPAEFETTVHSPTVALQGSTTGAVALMQVSSDRNYAGVLNGTTNWNGNVPLQPGLNRILVQASGANGHIVTAERLVRYVPCEPLQIANLAESAQSVERWTPLEVTFMLANSAATNPQFPYDPTQAPGLVWLDGVSVDALFTPDNWQTVYRRPAFLNQRYSRALKNNQEWLYPTGDPVWTVRFAPPQIGAWKYRIEARERKGSGQSAERTFSVSAPTNQHNHGPVRVAARDSRYFEFADGTPFLGSGHGISISADQFSYAAKDLFDTIGADNQNFFRWWLGGNIWGSAWQPWRSLTLGGDGYLPATGLSVDRAYGNGLTALKLDAANPLMFYGFESGFVGVIPGHIYRVRVRWRTENVTGPAVPGQPYGVTMKFVGWPEVGHTTDLPILIPHVDGDTPWHIAQADFTAQEDFIPNLAVILENTTGGTAYIDEIDVYEVLPGGTLGSQLLRNPRFNSYLTFDPSRSAGIDAIFAEADARGLYFKLVISEKAEYLLNHMAPDGLPDRNGGFFNGEAGSPARRLHEYYWRYLFARFGAFRAIQSWELVNEEDPGSHSHFRLAADLATQAAADGNPHLGSTSTWASLAEDVWKAPDNAPISYADFHAYARGTGWIEPKDALANDSARFFGEYDRAARAAGFNKPVIWGEAGIDNDGVEDPLLAQDQAGVWLHKLVWARCGPGGVYPLYWFTENIFQKSLHPIFGAWNRFMAGVPLANGRYEDIAATTSNPDLRVFGQKDLQAGSAYLWIDNRQDTWKATVDGKKIAALSGSVSIPLQRANASYRITWYDTATGQPSSNDTRSANAAGTLDLSISNLQTDIALKITPAP